MRKEKIFFCRSHYFISILTAMFIHSGDVAIMSGESRLAFHAVPRIFKVGEEIEPPDCLKWLNPKEISQNCKNGEEHLVDKEKETEAKNRQEAKFYKTSKINEGTMIDDEKSELICRCNESENIMDVLLNVSEDEWLPFERYLSRTRININVRQVHSLENVVN